MAALQSIRNHGAALVTTVGVAMLAFIMGDFLTSGSSLIHRDQDVMGVIAGHKVGYRDFEVAKERLTEAYRIENNRSTLNDEEQAWVRQQTWNALVQEYSLQAEGEKIGLTVTDNELANLCLGSNPHPMISGRRIFADENGQFSAANLQNFYNQVFRDGAEDGNMETARQYWLYWENAVRGSYLQEKYAALVQHLVKPNSLDAEFAHSSKLTTANAEFACQPYYTVADSLVKVTEADIEKLYEQRKPLYKQTPNRAISYITFDVTPSEADYNKVNEIMVKAEEDLKNAEDIALVTNMTSDLVYNEQDYSAETIPAEFKDFAFGKNAKKDDFRALEYNNETHTFSMARLVACGYSLPDSIELKAIAPADQEGAEDQELGWINAAQLASNKDFYQQAMHAKKGQRITMQQGDNAQEFEVLDISKATPKAKVAIITREVVASSRTYGDVYNRATQFIVNNPDEESLRKAAMQEGLAIRPQYGLDEMTEKIGELRDSRKIVRWAFEAKKGDISTVFDCGDQYVIAIVQDVNDGEYRSLNSVRGELTVMATKNAKAKYLQQQLKGIASVEEAAQKMGQSVKTAEGINLASAMLGQQGHEPAIVGAALAQEINQVSAPLQGENGVYVLRTLTKNTAEAELNVEAEKQALAQRNQYLYYQALQLIQDEANIQDNRARFY